MMLNWNKRRRHTRKNSYRRCAFTGYRPQKMPFGYDESDPRCVEFKAKLRETIESLIGEGYAHFLSGGAQGMDQFAAEIVVELKEKYPWILLEMVSLTRHATSSILLAAFAARRRVGFDFGIIRTATAPAAAPIPAVSAQPFAFILFPPLYRVEISIPGMKKFTDGMFFTLHRRNPVL